MDFYFWVATVTLAIQLFVLGLLIAGYVFKRQNKFRRHGLLMFTAVVLHIILVFVIMAPSLGVIVFTPTEISSATIGLAVVHAALGLITLILGVWIAATWRLRQSLQYCQPKKRIMRVTFILWIITIAVGATLYFSLYVLPLMTSV